MSEQKKTTKATEPEQPKTNDSLFHLPFIVVLIVLGVGLTQLVNSGLQSSKTDAELQKLTTEYQGYQSGVKDSR